MWFNCNFRLKWGSENRILPSPAQLLKKQFLITFLITLSPIAAERNHPVVPACLYHGRNGRRRLLPPPGGLQPAEGGMVGLSPFRDTMRILGRNSIGVHMFCHN